MVRAEMPRSLLSFTGLYLKSKFLISKMHCYTQYENSEDFAVNAENLRSEYHFRDEFLLGLKAIVLVVTSYTKVNVKECSDYQHLMDLSDILYNTNNVSLLGRILPIFDP